MLDEHSRKCLERPACSVAQAADLLGVSRQGILNAIGRGDIRASRVGKRIVVPTAQIRRMLMLDDVALNANAA